MGVTIVAELDEIGPSIDLDAGTGECTRRLVIAGEDLTALSQEMFGTVFVPGWGFTYSARPQHPRYTWMYGVSIGRPGSHPEGDPPHDPGVDYSPLILVHVKYRGDLLIFNVSPDDPTPPSGTYLTHRKTMSAEMMTLPDAGFLWEDSTETLPRHLAGDVSPGVLLPVITHTFTWRGVTYPPWDDIRDAAGKVNETDQFGLKAETCLFIGVSDERVFDLNGTKQYSLTYTFAERYLRGKDTQVPPQDVDVTWNHFYRKAIVDEDTPENSRDAGWCKIARKGTTSGEPIDPYEGVYDTFDFAKLFVEGP